MGRHEIVEKLCLLPAISPVIAISKQLAVSGFFLNENRRNQVSHANSLSYQWCYVSPGTRKNLNHRSVLSKYNSGRTGIALFAG
jgi:hypothetical protein